MQRLKFMMAVGARCYCHNAPENVHILLPQMTCPIFVGTGMPFAFFLHEKILSQNSSVEAGKCSIHRGDTIFTRVLESHFFSPIFP